MLTDKEVLQLQKDFVENIDKGIQFQKEINEFADMILEQLFYKINQTDATNGEFYDRYFAFTAFMKDVGFNKKVCTIKMFDLEQYRQYFKLGIPEKARATRADFELIPGEDVKTQFHSALVGLLFHEFGVEISAEAEEE
jgi:hypothetical protein